jgi:hypothetical protein
LDFGLIKLSAAHLVWQALRIIKLIIMKNDCFNLKSICLFL